jgi:hypothetical protein
MSFPAIQSTNCKESVIAYVSRPYSHRRHEAVILVY